MHDFWIGLAAGAVTPWIVVAVVIVVGLFGWMDNGSH